jgi:hypothetical protein
MVVKLISESKDFRISKIIIDRQFQTRIQEDPQAIRDIAEAAMDGEDDKLEPVVIFMLADGATLVAGFHRYAGRKLAGKQTIKANVFEGTLADAIEAAARSNREHRAVRFTRDDQRKAAYMIAANKELRQKYDAKGLAEMIGVDLRFMKNIIKAYDNPSATDTKPKVTTIVDKPRTTQTNLLDYAPPTTAQDGSPLVTDKVTPPSIPIPQITPTPTAPLYDDLEIGESWMLGDNVLHIGEISKVKKQLQTYDYCVYFGDLEVFAKHQTTIDDLSPALTIGIRHGADFPNVKNLGWEIEIVSFAAVRGVPYFLSHYGTINQPADLSVSEWGLFVAETSDSAVGHESIIVINPEGLCIPQLYGRGRAVTVVTTNLEYARAELLSWAQSHEAPVKV